LDFANQQPIKNHRTRGKEIMSSTLLTFERPAGRRKDSELLNGHTGTNGAALKVCFITREYPPNIYGGAGVHIKNLAPACAAWSGCSILVVFHFSTGWRQALIQLSRLYGPR
jgi:hypothetical protein